MAPFSTQTLRAWNELSQQSARAVLPTVFGLCRARSVIDVGCGFGAWAAECGRLGAREVVGVDGDYVARGELVIPAETFVTHDLIRPLRMGHRFDLAISLEVAHYLPESRAGGFVADLCKLAPLVLFSAAIPHQGGGGHVNERWPTWWAERFAEHDYIPVDCVRDEVWEDQRVASWYAQNTLLFVAADAHVPALDGHPGWGRCPARVHPTIYLAYAGGRYHALRRRMAAALEPAARLSAGDSTTAHSAAGELNRRLSPQRILRKPK
jgi:SAM-dependent methyltransferase